MPIVTIVGYRVECDGCGFKGPDVADEYRAAPAAVRVGFELVDGRATCRACARTAAHVGGQVRGVGQGRGGGRGEG